MMDREEEVRAVLDAWEDWVRLKRRSDQTLAFVDCHDTAQAWVRFQNLYLGDSNKLATMPTPSAVVLPYGGSA